MEYLNHKVFSRHCSLYGLQDYQRIMQFVIRPATLKWHLRTTIWHLVSPRRPKQTRTGRDKPTQTMPRQARRESRILMNNRINDQDVSVQCNLCGCLGRFFCRVIGFCVLLFFIYLLYGLIVFLLGFCSNGLAVIKDF